MPEQSFQKCADTQMDSEIQNCYSVEYFNNGHTACQSKLYLTLNILTSHESTEHGFSKFDCGGPRGLFIWL